VSAAKFQDLYLPTVWNEQKLKGDRSRIPGLTTAVLKSLFICVNLGYTRDLLRRPYPLSRIS